MKEATYQGILGLDTGGTFTDIVYMQDGLNGIVKAKTPTMHDNLVKTIENALNMIEMQADLSQARAFHIATTLATNAIVENKIRPVALILIGYGRSAAMAREANMGHTGCIYEVAGGHDIMGEEVEPLDEKAIWKIIQTLPDEIEAVAVSGMFSVRNNDHELKVVEMIKEMRPDLYTTCGHDITMSLDAIKRATTTVMNGGLIPIAREFIDSVEQVCAAKNLNVDISVMKSDGTLAGIEWAKTHPVEMILSGPAGSACSAKYLTDHNDESKKSWIIDIGGTTTDVIALDEKGYPELLEDGATVANHKTLVRAVNIHTFGLGGDSRVHENKWMELSLGARRVIPICRLAKNYPDVLGELQNMEKSGYEGEPLFIVPKLGLPEEGLETDLMLMLADGPKSLASLCKVGRYKSVVTSRIEYMYEKGLVEYAAFTPTDALHVLERLDIGNVEAAKIAARLMSPREDRDERKIAETVYRLVIEKICIKMMMRSFKAKGLPTEDGGDIHQLVTRAIQHENGVDLLANLKLNARFIGVGAPAWAFIKEAGAELGEEGILPVSAEVAGAIGTAMASFSIKQTVRLSPFTDGGYRLHYPEGTEDFMDEEEATEFAVDFMNKWMIGRAREAGAIDPVISYERVEGPTPGLNIDAPVDLIFEAKERA